jgi:hypothetical protein
MAFGDRTITFTEAESEFLQSLLLEFKNYGIENCGTNAQMLDAVLTKVEQAPASMS